MQASAQIILLPTAAPFPIVQKNGRGRHPKKIFSYWAFMQKKRERERAAVAAAALAKKIQQNLEVLDDMERILCMRRQQLKSGVLLAGLDDIGEETDSLSRVVMVESEATA